MLKTEIGKIDGWKQERRIGNRVRSKHGNGWWKDEQTRIIFKFRMVDDSKRSEKQIDWDWDEWSMLNYDSFAVVTTLLVAVVGNLSLQVPSCLRSSHSIALQSQFEVGG